MPNTCWKEKNSQSNNEKAHMDGFECLYRSKYLSFAAAHTHTGLFIHSFLLFIHCIV